MADEVALVCAYLDVQQERMETRLRYEIQVPEELMASALPPLLLQPLVESDQTRCRTRYEWWRCFNERAHRRGTDGD